MKMRISPLALAIAAVCASPLAMGQVVPPELPPPSLNPVPEVPESITDTDATVDAGGFKFVGKVVLENDFIDYQNRADVHLIKKSLVRKIVDIEGDVAVTGEINVDSAANAIIDEKQVSLENDVFNDAATTNSATTEEGVATGASGNVGLNVVAGDANQQGNDAALAAADASEVFGGSADAQSFSYQDGEFNSASNSWVNNTATISTGTLDGASGNVGLNVTAGNFNQQKNNFAAAVSTGRLAEANAYAKQESTHNTTDNVTLVTPPTEGGETVFELDEFGQHFVAVPGAPGTPGTVTPVTNTASLAGLTNISGNLGVNLSAGTHNQQQNTLAIAASTTSALPGPISGGGAAPAP
ncbi:MAG: hypothetical protein M3Z21_16845 [Pseudomonadota bacterium]|nr:hypothetical protein [Pseudomonadota bacterium]